ncbi:MAG: DUF2207 domain-containing protein, partial [Firmicutes bacterium]|nr:DUF2207 domain-containing protein [Bacillota bacterium]
MKISKMSRIFIILFLIFIVFLITNKVHANSIDSINMDIYIDSSGNAQVTEVWNVDATQGTEIYHPYYNLGNSKITNLTVSNGNTKYTTLNSWNVDASFNDKINKCGINFVSDGVELCWGISSYGTHTYTVSYNISNFVSELTDSQMVYWTLIPSELSNSVGSVNIKIHSSISFPQTIDVWGYGQYGAPCYVQDGAIQMSSNGILTSSEYMTILAEFPLGTFNTSNNLYNNFDYYYNMAEEGATSYNSSDVSNIANLTTSFLNVLFYVVIIVGIVFSSIFAHKRYNETSLALNFGKDGKKLPKDIPYFREIPCNGDIFRGYFIAYNYGIMKNKTDFLGAILLKWLKEGKIRIEKKTYGKIFSKEETCIVLDSSFNSDNLDENDIHTKLYKASGDGILESNEFKKWCSTHYQEVLGWFDDVLKSERDVLVSEGKIEETESGIFKSKKYIVDSSLKDEAIQLKGLKNFLKD